MLRGSILSLEFAAIERKRKLAAQLLSITLSLNSWRPKLEVTLHRTIARTEGEEVEIGEPKKDNGQFLECPPCNEEAEMIKRALRWSSQPLDIPAEQHAVNLPREAIRRAQESDEICRLIKKELERSETVGNVQLSRGYVMEEGAICKISGATYKVKRCRWPIKLVGDRCCSLPEACKEQLNRGSRTRPGLRSPPVASGRLRSPPVDLARLTCA